MSDIDKFMKEQRQDDRIAPRRKQDRFEFRVLSQLLRALEPQPGWAKRVMYSIGDDLGFAWFNSCHEQCPLKLSTYKLKSTIGLVEIVKRYEKTALHTAFEELRSNYPDEPVGLVFDSTGSGLQELVLHNRCDIALSGWQIQLETEDGPLMIAPFKGFLYALSTVFQLGEP